MLALWNEMLDAGIPIVYQNVKKKFSSWAEKPVKRHYSSVHTFE
jgi:hypothetical protein